MATFLKSAWLLAAVFVPAQIADELGVRNTTGVHVMATSVGVLVSLTILHWISAANR